MGEDGRAIALDMLIEPNAGASLGYDRCERGLADLKRIAPQVVAVTRSLSPRPFASTRWHRVRDFRPCTAFGNWSKPAG
jgi:hypothetical protein